MVSADLLRDELHEWMQEDLADKVLSKDPDSHIQVSAAEKGCVL